MSAVIVRLIMEADVAGKSPKQFFTDLMAKSPDEAFDRLEDWRIRDFGDASQAAKGILRQVFGDDIPIKTGWEQLSREAADTGIIADLIGSVYKAVSENRPDATMSQAKALIKGIEPAGVSIKKQPYWVTDESMVSDIDDPIDIEDFEKEHTKRISKRTPVVDIEKTPEDVEKEYGLTAEPAAKPAAKPTKPVTAPRWSPGKGGTIPKPTKRPATKKPAPTAKAAPTLKQKKAKLKARKPKTPTTSSGMNIPNHLKEILSMAGSEKPRNESRAPMLQRIDEALEDLTGHLARGRKSLPLFLGKGLRSWRGEAEAVAGRGTQEAELRKKAGMPAQGGRRTPSVKKRIEALKQGEKAKRLKLKRKRKKAPIKKTQDNIEKEYGLGSDLGTNIKVGFEEQPGVDMADMIKKAVINDIEAQMVGDHPDLKKLIKKQVIKYARTKGLSDNDIDVDEVVKEIYQGQI